MPSGATGFALAAGTAAAPASIWTTGLVCALGFAEFALPSRRADLGLGAGAALTGAAIWSAGLTLAIGLAEAAGDLPREAEERTTALAYVRATVAVVKAA